MSSISNTTIGGGIPQWKNVRINRPGDLKRLLTRLINMHLRGEVTSETLRAVTYCANTIISTFPLDTFEQRLSKLEEQLNEVT